MAFLIPIFDKDQNATYQVRVDVVKSVDSGTTTGEHEYYLTISTTYRHQGESFPTFIVKSLSDEPPGFSNSPSTFSELIKDYVDYFTNYFILESSSSSESSSSESTSSTSL